MPLRLIHSTAALLRLSVRPHAKATTSNNLSGRDNKGACAFCTRRLKCMKECTVSHSAGDRLGAAVTVLPESGRLLLVIMHGNGAVGGGWWCGRGRGEEDGDGKGQECEVDPAARLAEGWRFFVKLSRWRTVERGGWRAVKTVQPPLLPGCWSPSSCLSSYTSFYNNSQ